MSLSPDQVNLVPTEELPSQTDQDIGEDVEKEGENNGDSEVFKITETVIHQEQEVAEEDGIKLRDSVNQDFDNVSSQNTQKAVVQDIIDITDSDIVKESLEENGIISNTSSTSLRLSEELAMQATQIIDEERVSLVIPNSKNEDMIGDLPTMSQQEQMVDEIETKDIVLPMDCADGHSNEGEPIITHVEGSRSNVLDQDGNIISFACLICNASVELRSEDFEDVKIDYESLSLIYRVDTTSEEFQNSIKDDQRQGSFTDNQFCKSCVNEVNLLQEYHCNMKKAVNKFEVHRDKLASGMLQTFLFNQEVVEDPLPAAKSGFQLEVFEKWKNIYTGKEDKEQEILWMVKQRESRASKINKRIAKVKSSLRRSRHTMKDGPQPTKTMAQIQKAMTAAYFTPKVSLMRKKNRLYVKVPIMNKMDGRYTCPICDKVFPKKDTMTIHTRSHVGASGKLYKCSICDKVCSDRQKLINHRKEHTEDQKNMKCVLCDKTFYRKGALRNHLRTQHQRESYSCTMCEKKFVTSSLLKRHVALHSNVDFSITDMYSCKTCYKTFLKSQDLNDHLRIHEDANVFGCSYCGKAFTLDKAYQEHLEIHQGGNPYICESEGCNLRFSSEALLTSHLKIHRPKDFTCEKCGKACRSRDGLRKHDLTHTGNKPYSCQICDIGFIERKSFDAHMVKHTGKLPYKCNLCKSDEGFKDAKDIRKHKVERHHEMLPKDKNFSCEFCWHGFPSPEAVAEHVAKIHERYKCHLCNRVFKLGDHLRRHMYIHTGEKPYPCTLCSKTFNQESNLKEHMYRHTGTRPHKCPYCPDVGYLRRMHLKEHMMKEHGTDKVPSLPMGRAAHNARKTGMGPMGMIFDDHPDTILGDIYPASPRVETQTTEQIIPGIGGSSVYLKNLHNANNLANQQKISGQGPLLMRALSGSAGAVQNPVFVRRIPQLQQNIQSATIIRKPNEQNLDIPTINIKSDNDNLRYSIVDTGDPNLQQYIILL